VSLSLDDPANRVAVSPRLVVPALGLTQILAWGSSFYLPAVLAQPVASDTGWSLTWVVGGLSIGLLIAGLTSPFVGRQIHRYGGRPVLAASSILLSAGLFGLALAPNLAVFVLCWVVLGFGMSAGLYDAAFSTLGHLFGRAARHHIAVLTLFGGLASTVCWPLSAYMVTELGWRGACAVYAVIQIALCLPLHLLVLPKTAARTANRDEIDIAPVDAQRDKSAAMSFRSSPVFLLLAVTITIGSTVSTVVSVHLLTILQAQGIALAAAVALGALIGPAQVGARFIEILVGRYHHPIWTKIASVTLVALGLGLLWSGAPIVFLALIFYGAGIGLESIARATLPLELYGSRDYALIVGKIARPSLIAQAAAPSIGAFLIETLGAQESLAAIVLLAGANVLLAAILFGITRSPPKQGIVPRF